MAEALLVRATRDTECIALLAIGGVLAGLTLAGLGLRMSHAPRRTLVPNG